MRIAFLFPLLAFLAACAAENPTSSSSSQAAADATDPPAALPYGALADYVLVDKSERSLTLFANGQVLKTYRDIAFGDAPQGHKQFEGDERTPEGRYYIDARNPGSAYHLSLRISYPNGADRAFAANQGLSPGGDIFIHGQPNNYSGDKIAGNWTDGCIAVSDEEIEELWRAIADGTIIEIIP